MLTQTSIELTVEQINLVMTEPGITSIKSISGKNQLIVGCVDGLYRQVEIGDGILKWLDSW